MLRKLLVLFLIILAGTPLAFAKNNRYPPKANYSVLSAHRYYKGELPPQKPVYPVVMEEHIPCWTYTFNSGFYLGLNPGIRSNYSVKSLANYKSLEGTVFGGYRSINSRFYLAAEIFAQHGITLQNYTNAVNANGNTIGLKTTWGTGFSILPGYIIADTLLGYLRLGTIMTHFQDIAQTKTGGQLGIGLESTITETWDFRVEYAYSFYPSIPVLGNPRSDQFHIGIIYKIT